MAAGGAIGPNGAVIGLDANQVNAAIEAGRGAQSATNFIGRIAQSGVMAELGGGDFDAGLIGGTVGVGTSALLTEARGGDGAMFAVNGIIDLGVNQMPLSNEPTGQLLDDDGNLMPGVIDPTLPVEEQHRLQAEALQRFGLLPRTRPGNSLVARY